MRVCSISSVCVGLSLLCLLGCGRWDNAPTSGPPLVNRAFEVNSIVPGSHESYERLPENQLVRVKDQPLSTFSIDVDTASYSNVRRFLRLGQLPPVDAVRIEELINYFPYDDPQPIGDVPFSVNVEVAGCPWNHEHRLARIGLKGKAIQGEERPAANVVFLIDVSGSMNHPKKLPLVKASMKMLVEQLGESDHVGIVVYAGASGLALPATSASNKSRIHAAIDSLQPGGSTNGAMGIRLGYDIARQNFVPGGINRVILCTDGDFNVGVTSRSELEQLIKREAQSGVFLTVLGYGMGNLKDSTMEMLADRGNGNYGYVDNIAEARKLLVEQVSGTLITIAKDVKIQVEFNPAQVAGYRLIGYENRRLANRDFRDDSKDAGDVGAGHSVTALYELVPTGAAIDRSLPNETLRYEGNRSDGDRMRETVVTPNVSDELFLVKLRYKEPTGSESRLLEFPIADGGQSFELASPNLRFAAAVAEFGMLLTNSQYRSQASYDAVIETAKSASLMSGQAYRDEFVELVRLARDLTTEQRLVSSNKMR